MDEQYFNLAEKACTIVQLEGWADSLPAFEAVLAPQVGGTLPTATGDTARFKQRHLIRIAPRRFWLLSDEGLSPDLKIDQALGCSISLSQGRTRLKLTGQRLFEVLSSCVAIDWGSPIAAPGKAIQTGFHRVPILLLRTGDFACDLVAPRSFSQSLSAWIIDMAASPGQPVQLNSAKGQ